MVSILRYHEHCWPGFYEVVSVWRQIFPVIEINLLADVYRCHPTPSREPQSFTCSMSEAAIVHYTRLLQAKRSCPEDWVFGRVSGIILLFSFCVHVFPLVLSLSSVSPLA